MQNKFEILMIMEAEMATTQIIERVLIPLESHGYAYKKRLSMDVQASDFDSNTIPLFMRCSNPSLMAWIDFIKLKNHPYLYYIDDNFWELEGDSPNAKYYQDKLIRKSLEYMISKASMVLTNSIDLAKSVMNLNNNTQVLPPIFDFSLIKKSSKIHPNETRIGFASSGRDIDLDIIVPVIFDIIDKFPQVIFEFVGVRPRNINETEKIRFFPYITNYAEYLKFQMERCWDIGLAPLIDNAVNRCKTNNKYREYGACGIASIYSDVTPYRRSVKPDVTGILVENLPESWLNAISRLIEDQKLRKEISENAYSDVQSKYSVDVVLEEWLNPIKSVASQLQHANI